MWHRNKQVEQMEITNNLFSTTSHFSGCSWREDDKKGKQGGKSLPSHVTSGAFSPQTPGRWDVSHLFKQRMLAFACPAAIQGKGSHCKILPGNGNPLRNTLQSCYCSFSTWHRFPPEQPFHLKLHLLWASPCSKASFCSSSVFFS